MKSTKNTSKKSAKVSKKVVSSDKSSKKVKLSKKEKKSSSKSDDSEDQETEGKKRGRVVEKKDKPSTKSGNKIDMEKEGKALASGIASDFDAEIEAGMSRNGRCFVIEFQHKNLQIVVLVFNNNKFLVKAQLCENALFNQCVRTVIGKSDTQKFLYLAFFKGSEEKALAVPYVPSSKEAVA